MFATIKGDIFLILKVNRLIICGNWLFRELKLLYFLELIV